MDTLLAATTYGRWTPPLLSMHGEAIDQLISVLHYFMAILFVGWGIFFVMCLVKFRRRPGHQAQYQFVKAKASKYAEVGVLLFEVFLLVGLSMPVWADYKNKPPTAADHPLQVHVIAQQFQWNFHYAGPDGRFGPRRVELIAASNPIGLVEDDADAKDDIVTIGELHLPVGRKIYLRITSKDVIHSFDIPTMRVKQDAVPGMEIPIWFEVLETATTDQIRNQMIETIPIGKVVFTKRRHFVLAEDAKDKSGKVLLAQGADLGLSATEFGEKVAELKAAGLTELTLWPRNPIEVVCAQLCGNSHFKMTAQVMTYTQSGFEAWLEARVKEKTKGVEIDF